MSRSYSTTNIVILDGAIYAEDGGHETGQFEVPERVARYLDAKHLRKFVDFDGAVAMHHFTVWLFRIEAIVNECRIFGPELSDEERDA